MAILGKGPMGMFNPANIKPKEEEVKEEIIIEPIVTESAPVEDPIKSGPGASREFFDRMRELKGVVKKPIGTQLQSDAKAMNGNNRFGS